MKPNNIDPIIEKSSHLSEDEKLLIEYIREHPEELEKLLNELKK